VRRLWGNIGRPWHDNVGVRPWDQSDQPPTKREFGNGVLTTVLDFAAADWRDRLAAEPTNAAVRDGKLVQADPTRPGEITLRVLTPYIIADGRVTLDAAGEGVRVEAGEPEARAAVRPGEWFTAQKLNRPGVGPVSRYACLFHVQLADRVALSALRLETVVQLNPLALPTLLAGENQITIHGDLAVGQAVEVTYVWDDADGKARAHTARAASLPFTYTIAAAGTGWADVLCREQTIRVVPDDGQGSRILADVPAPSVVPAGPLPSADVRTTIGPDAAPKLKTAAEYVKDLQSADAETRLKAACGLAVLRDPSAWDALVKTAFEDLTQAKLAAVQALFWTDRRRAVPVLRRMLRQDPAVKFPPKGADDEQPTHANVLGTVAVLCGLTGCRDLVPEIAEMCYETSTATRWGCVRALGRLADPRGFEAIRRFTRSGNDDTATVANEAAGMAGDREAIPNLQRWLASKRYPIRTLKAVESLGRLGDPVPTDWLIERLAKPSEDWRAVIAETLARVGDPKQAIDALEAAAAKEQWPWVRQTMQAALARLRERQKQTP